MVKKRTYDRDELLAKVPECPKCNDRYLRETCPNVGCPQDLPYGWQVTPPKPTTLDVQVDGEHYKNFPIQPAVYSYKNNLGWHEGEIVKYITRHRLKNGKPDLEKAKHLIEMLIELEYDSS